MSPFTNRQRSSYHRSEEHTSELQSHSDLVCRLLLEKKKKEKTPRERRKIPAQTAVVGPSKPASRSRYADLRARAQMRQRHTASAFKYSTLDWNHTSARSRDVVE